jgi:hypothetical protein
LELPSVAPSAVPGGSPEAITEAPEFAPEATSVAETLAEFQIDPLPPVESMGQTPAMAGAADSAFTSQALARKPGVAWVEGHIEQPKQ